MHLATSFSRNLTGILAATALVCAATAPAAADGPLGPTESIPGNAQFTSATGLISLVDPNTVDCVQVTTFDDVAGGPAPGANYDGIFPSIGVYFAERFVGQTIAYNGNFDVITGVPSNPLQLQPGLAGQNLNVFDNSTNVLTGLGPLGFPEADAIGEGAVAMFFPIAQAQLSLQIVGGNAGSATLDFYRADGSLIDTIVLAGLGDATYGFQRVGGPGDIGGVLIQNDDPAGIGFDNICHDVAVTDTRPETWGRIKTLYR